jgi:midasin (ATPase involved in ribosome maturation)
MDVNVWQQWLSQLDPKYIPALKEALSIQTPKPNGVSVHKESPSQDITIKRMPTDACYVAAPAYIDVLGLIPIYDRLAFKNNLLLKGPKGVGKSLSYIAWAAHKKVPMVSVECSEDVKKYDLMGSPFIVGNETIFLLGGVPTAIEIANEVGRCILAFEEINSLTPQVQKMLNAVSDFRQAVSLPAIGKVYRLREGAEIWIVASMNPSVYGGTYDLNEDLKSRFEEIEVTYPRDHQERAILKQVGSAIQDELLNAFLMLAKETRSGGMGYPLSTRDLVRITHNINTVGIDITLQMLMGKFEHDDKEVVLKRLGSIFHGVKLPSKFWGAP